jgi:NAD(P)-dependent dehydrogenase (short-subunit alcohol dehydrogenase family)
MKHPCCGTSRRVWKKSERDLKTVFITGCSTGIGRSAAVLFAQNGYRVMATARKLESIRDLEIWARVQNYRLEITPCDVTDEVSMISAVENAHQVFGGIHILVNNAGYGAFGPVELASIEEARRQMETNVFGAMRLVQLIVPDMRRAGWGRIINVSSVVGKIALPHASWYSASKFALESLTDSLRMQLIPFGIHVVSIIPGPVKTEFVSNVELPDAEGELARVHEPYRGFAARLRSRKRTFEVAPDEVARLIVKAAEAKTPCTRYVITLTAHVGLWLRRFMPDRLWDAFLVRAQGFRRVQQELKQQR